MALTGLHLGMLKAIEAVEGQRAPEPPTDRAVGTRTRLSYAGMVGQNLLIETLHQRNQVNEQQEAQLTILGEFVEYAGALEADEQATVVKRMYQSVYQKSPLLSVLEHRTSHIPARDPITLMYLLALGNMPQHMVLLASVCQYVHDHGKSQALPEFLDFTMPVYVPNNEVYKKIWRTQKITSRTSLILRRDEKPPSSDNQLDIQSRWM